MQPSEPPFLLPLDVGVPWLDAGVPWLDAGVPWLDVGVPYTDRGLDPDRVVVSAHVINPNSQASLKVLE
eukprot:8566216-Pyramimonas_sp.AAC.1